MALDRKRWTALWSRLGAQGDGGSTFDQLSQAYAEPTRVYHAAEHILDCLAQLDEHHGLAQRLPEIEGAIWFHDAVYDPAAAENEEQSAKLAHSTLSAAAVPADVVHRIEGMILATRHLTLPDDPDAQLLCDIDLSIFGRDPERFEIYERQIRQEYAWVPEPTYRRARAEILAGFLRRRTLYLTAAFRERYEAAARKNLRHLISQLAR